MGAIAGGAPSAKPSCYFYLVNLETGKQTKMTSKKLSSVSTVCFVNSDLVAVAGAEGVEIWNLEEASATKLLRVGEVTGLAFANNMLSVCSGSEMGLWDVRSWEMFYSKDFQMEPQSVHFSPDLSNLTVAGRGG